MLYIEKQTMQDLDILLKQIRKHEYIILKVKGVDLII